MHVTNLHDQHRIRKQVYTNVHAPAGMCGYLKHIQAVHETSL
jgi:hypothetical protein